MGESEHLFNDGLRDGLGEAGQGGVHEDEPNKR